MNDEINDDEQQLIKLCLKKPKQWNWELTTSKSYSNILFPTIQLYDEQGKTLLAEANEAGITASSKLKKSASTSKASSRSSFKFKVREDSIGEITLNPIITEPEDDIKLTNGGPASPVQIQSEHGILLRDKNSKELKKTKNEKPRNKPYSRCSSSNSMRSRSSVSILERISELKRSSSSDESDVEMENEKKNERKYSYRQCTIGTIIVPKQSFSNVRRRPKKNDDDVDETTTGELRLFELKLF